MRILFVASEGLPFSKTGGLADVVEGLPKALVALGHEVGVVLPRYRGTKVSAIVLPSLTIPMGNRLRFPAVADGTLVAGVRYYFVDDPEYFDREQLYGEQGTDYPDNAERFAEFSRAAIEIAKHIWPPDVIHCHDWQTALVPVLLRTLYADDLLVRGVPVVFTIHNLGYHGLFPREILGRLGLPENLFHMDALEFYGKVNYLKAGLVFSDYLTTVSRKYAQEIQTPEYGHGLDGVVRRRADSLQGILNGVDYSAWSPEQDKLIAAQYSAIVALGTGEPKHESLFRELASRFPGKVGVKIAYDNTLAHKIEAGADIFLMPSRYEPCGLNQIYSLRYGTVPVVRATGGLDDTIEPFDAKSGRGNGFKFEAYTGQALVGCIRQALTVYQDDQAWRKVQANGMAQDFSWKVSAVQYAQLYEKARKGRISRAAGSSN